VTRLGAVLLARLATWCGRRITERMDNASTDEDALVRSEAAKHRAGEEAFQDETLRPLLLDAPTVMGVESFEVDQVNLRMVARTLPGKQFDVARELRIRIAVAFQREGLVAPAESVTSPDPEGA
jgi:moderate conductance mechanosensitive channel